MRRQLLLFVIARILTAQIGPPVAPNGSISGVVTDSTTGAPLADVLVSSGGENAVRSTTDPAGEYKLAGLPPGSYRVSANHGGQVTFYPYTHLDPGQSVTLNLRIAPPPEISGAVVDEHQNALEGATVFLIRSEYRAGVLRRVVAQSETTGRDGRYAFTAELQTGREYVLLAQRANSSPNAAEDRALRKPVSRTTYFPDAAAFEGALPVSLQPGERRNDANIRMPDIKPLCVEGTVTSAGKPSATDLRIETDAAIGIPALHTSSAADGRYRACGLIPGRYRLSAGNDQLQGSGEFQLADTDLHGVNLDAAPALPARLEITWDTPPPPGMATAYVHLGLIGSGGRTVVNMDRSFPYSGNFGSAFPPGEYEIRTQLNDNLYIKRITYGGQEVLQYLVNFTAAGDTTFHVVVGRDGSLLELTVHDTDGHPVPEAPVILIPDGVNSVPVLSARMVVGRTNGAGMFDSTTLAPGRYSVLACSQPIGTSPEELAKLFDARGQAQSVELVPRATATLTVQPVSLE